MSNANIKTHIDITLVYEDPVGTQPEEREILQSNMQQIMQRFPVDIGESPLIIPGRQQVHYPVNTMVKVRRVKYDKFAK